MKNRSREFSHVPDEYELKPAVTKALPVGEMASIMCSRGLGHCQKWATKRVRYISQRSLKLQLEVGKTTNPREVKDVILEGAKNSSRGIKHPRVVRAAEKTCGRKKLS